jgi:uncharacterized membrane protein YhaH (DUF805 family)
MPRQITEESDPELYRACLEVRRLRELNRPKWYHHLIVWGVIAAIFMAVLYSWIYILGEWTRTGSASPSSIGQEYDLFYQACECQP